MITKLTTDLSNVQKLDQFPNDGVGGLGWQQLQALYDKAGNDIKTYINDILTVGIDLKEDSSNITSNRKLSADGNFTGLINGSPAIASDAGLQATVTTIISDAKFEVATGTPTSIIVTMQALTNGYVKTFIANGDNGGNLTTINAKPLYKPNGTATPTLKTGFLILFALRVPFSLSVAFANNTPEL